ncbi:MFS transporter [Kitasatospora sp. NBC_01250]|uniref:MFS transporter n=1 Tax=unclassified Kitasatospora TaxID=2633591 RepID=UPI002E11D984|nr:MULTISPECIES: MFS transporter [unclassified Kitasatospora]WSJ71379.1 MFS transporter [Kitasatospora sp. NBC_01302]
MTDRSPRTAAAAPDRRRRRLVLAACSMSMLIVVLDFTAMNVALPTVQRDLHTSVAGLQWTLTAYGLVLASLQLLAGSTGDRIGRRRTFQAGLSLFGLGSALCALAPSLEWLVVFRVLQAIGGAVLAPVSLSIISNTFTGERERARAIGLWSGVAGIGLVAGPLLGGVLVGSTGWRSIFWLSLLVALGALVLTTRYVPESKAARPRRIDPVGQLLVLTLLAPLCYAIIEAPQRGWGDPMILAALALAAASVTVLPLWERRSAEPLIDLRFFHSVRFSLAVVIALGAAAACSAFLFLATLYLQDARGFSALRTGLWMLPMAVATAGCALLAGRLTGNHGPRLPLLISGAAVTGSGLVFTLLHAESSAGPLVLAGYLLIGVGYGMFAAPVTHMVVSGMPRAQAGVAGGIAMTSRLVGQTLGIAVTGALLSAGLHHRTHVGLAVFAEASCSAWWVVTGCGVAVLVLGVLATTRWAARSSRRTDALPQPEAGPADGQTDGPAGGPAADDEAGHRARGRL